MQLDDPRLMPLKAECLANSLAVSTAKAYGYRFRYFVEFCDRAEVSHLMSGDDPQADEKTLVGFVLYEFGIQQNKHSTIQGKISAIRWHVMASPRHMVIPQREVTRCTSRSRLRLRHAICIPSCCFFRWCFLPIDHRHHSVLTRLQSLDR